MGTAGRRCRVDLRTGGGSVVRVRPHVMELEEAGLATASHRSNERASPASTTPDLPPDGRRNVPRPCRRRTPPQARPSDGCLLRAFQLSDEQIQRAIEDDGQVAGRVGVAHEIAGASKLLFHARVNGNLQLVTCRSDGLNPGAKSGRPGHRAVSGRSWVGAGELGRRSMSAASVSSRLVHATSSRGTAVAVSARLVEQRLDVRRGQVRGEETHRRQREIAALETVEQEASRIDLNQRGDELPGHAPLVSREAGDFGEPLLVGELGGDPMFKTHVTTVASRYSAGCGRPV